MGGKRLKAQSNAQLFLKVAFRRMIYLDKALECVHIIL